MFPDDGKTDVITCCKLTQDFLIFATEVGSSVCTCVQCVVVLLICCARRLVLYITSSLRTGSM